jgi:pullulanase/glycogen debranching enzyme
MRFREVGRSHPIGATIIGGGVNFCVYSSDASSVELLLFHYEDDGQPEVIALDPSGNRTYPTERRVPRMCNALREGGGVQSAGWRVGSGRARGPTGRE